MEVVGTEGEMIESRVALMNWEKTVEPAWNCVNDASTARQRRAVDQRA